jgi:hypothetical protein
LTQAQPYHVTKIVLFFDPSTTLPCNQAGFSDLAGAITGEGDDSPAPEPDEGAATTNLIEKKMLTINYFC